MKKLDFPINRCTIDITEKCNLACTYCFTYGVGKRDLTWEQGKKTIDWLFKDEVSQSDMIDINWWGGEPLLKFDLVRRLTDYALEKSNKEGKKLHIGGTTNTTLMTKEVVDWMKQYNVFFLMSIDGPKDIQDDNRPAKKGSSWDKLSSNLPYVMKQLPFLGSRMSPTPKYIDRMAETYKYLFENFNIRSQMFSPVYELEWTKEDLNIAEEQLKQISDMIIEERLKGNQFNVKHLDDGAKQLEIGKNQAEYPCGAGRFYVGISVDGVIYPCHRFNKYDGSSWNEKEYIGTIDDGILRPDFRSKFLNYITYKKPKKCEDCDLYGNLCDTCCYAVSYDIDGNIFSPPDVYCNWTRVQANAIKYYHKQLKKNNLTIPGMERKQSMSSNSCICNNMCYMEGTQQEIINVDETGEGCICNNTNYTGGLDSQARKLTDYEQDTLLRKQSKSNLQVSSQGADLLEKLFTQLQRTEESNLKMVEAIDRLTELLQK